MGITVQEAKTILWQETPVIFSGNEYVKINALIFRKREGRYVATAELLDKNLNSVAIVPLDWITPAEEGQKIELIKDEEIQVKVSKAEYEIAIMLERAQQGKAAATQESLHKLLSILLSLDTDLIQRIRHEEEQGLDVGASEEDKGTGIEEIIPQREDEKGVAHELLSEGL